MADDATPWWRREAVVEATLAVGVGVFALAGVAAELRGATRPVPPAAGGYVLAAATAAVLRWRRRWPGVVAVTALLLVGLYHLLDYPGEAPAVALFVSFYSLAAYGRTFRSLVGAGVLVALAYLLPTLPPDRVPWTSPAIYGSVISMFWVALLGTSVRNRRLENADRVRRAAAVAEAEIRQRLTEERLRIARDLHDSLAHTISMIVVQGGNALDSLDHGTDEAREALTIIRAASRHALVELRATLGLLRTSGAPGGAPGGADTRPQPRLDQIAEVMVYAESAGLHVDLHVDGGVDDLAPLVQLTAYRIVQEALTNAIRHAQARSVLVCLRRQPTTLLVTVADDGRGPQPATGTGLGTDLGTGLGLLGMRERVEALGGTVRVGPGRTGGYRVIATLPL